jgi:hypothetical protein
MFRPSDTAFNSWLFSEETFHSLYGDSDSDSGEGNDHDKDAHPPRATRSRKSFYSVQDRYDSFFYTEYLSDTALELGIENQDSRRGKKFRRRFRVPYCIFIEICKDIERINGVRRETDRAGDKTIPIGLLVLAALRILGSGCTFEAVEELTAVSEETHRKFFHEQFCRWGEKAAKEHITMPESKEDLLHVLRQYEEKGFPGCVGSIDCVHLIWDKCPAGALSSCKGKGSFPTLAFEVVCSNTRKILSVSQFFYGTTNDKTIAMADEVR